MVVTVTVAGRAVAVAACVMAVGTAVAGPAGAAPQTRTEVVALNCVGLSPNIVDVPYSGGVRVVSRSGRPGIITITGGGTSFTRYRSDAVITVRNLTAGTAGSLRRTYLHTVGGSTASGFTTPDIYTGSGRVSITTTATNYGLLTLPAPRCTGTITVH